LHPAIKCQRERKKEVDEEISEGGEFGSE